jgi:hypothetical protein
VSTNRHVASRPASAHRVAILPEISDSATLAMNCGGLAISKETSTILLSLSKPGCESRRNTLKIGKCFLWVLQREEKKNEPCCPRLRDNQHTICPVEWKIGTAWTSRSTDQCALGTWDEPTCQVEGQGPLASLCQSSPESHQG